MRELRNLPGITIHESLDLVTVTCTDGYVIKAYHKNRKDPYKFDWNFDDTDYIYSPTKPEHLVLRKMLSDALNAKKIAKRPFWEKR
jgi:hypothetical protein